MSVYKEEEEALDIYPVVDSVRCANMESLVGHIAVPLLPVDLTSVENCLVKTLSV